MGAIALQVKCQDSFQRFVSKGFFLMLWHFSTPMVKQGLKSRFPLQKAVSEDSSKEHKQRKYKYYVSK